MNMRVGWARIMPKEWSDNEEAGKCPPCGLPKSKWKRRKDWRCCSTACTQEYIKTAYKSWPVIRDQALKRDNYTCVRCWCNGSDIKLEGDHIVPVALGGDEFDVDNVQTLCFECHKEKTKEDMAAIVVKRKEDKLKQKGQTFL